MMTLDLPGHSLHGQTFEIVKRNARHKFAVGRLTARCGEYRKGDELRFSGTLLAALKANA